MKREGEGAETRGKAAVTRAPGWVRDFLALVESGRAQSCGFSSEWLEAQHFYDPDNPLVSYLNVAEKGGSVFAECQVVVSLVGDSVKIFRNMLFMPSWDGDRGKAAAVVDEYLLRTPTPWLRDMARAVEAGRKAQA